MATGLEFIDILDKISSVQQEKSGMQMNQSCTINISRATAIVCGAQYMRIGVQSSGEDPFFLEIPFLYDPLHSTDSRCARVVLLFRGRAIQRSCQRTENVILSMQLPLVP